MTQSTEQNRAEFTDGAWYWVEKEGWHDEPPKIAPAMYRADCDAWYSWEFSGISTEYLKVLEPCVRHEQAARRAPVVPQDPMDWPLPCDVTVGHGTVGKGVKLRTLVLRMKALYKVATGNDADEVAARIPEQRATLLAAFQSQIAAAPHPPEAEIQPKVCKTEIQTIGCNEAAPVQLPEPKFTANKRGRLIEVDPLIGAFDLKDGGYVLYTEQDLQQVRQLLASTNKPE